MRAVRIVLGRLLGSLPTLLGIVVANFFLIRLVPGDIVDALLAEGGDDGLRASLRQEFGLDRPVIVQFGLYLSHLLRFDLGFSYTYSEPVLTVIGQRLGPTLLLMVASLGIAALLGIVAGAVAAMKPGSVRDGALNLLGLLLYGTPSFWTGLMLIVVFAIKLRLLPVGGFRDAAVHGAWPVLRNVLWHLVLPAVTLSLFHLALFARLMRRAMIEVFRQDFVRVAHAKGLTAARVIVRHVMRNALIPVVTLIGVQAGALVGGAVVVETVFAWPGIGRLAFDAVLRRDYPLLLGLLLVSAMLVIAINLLLDLVYAWLDPRLAGP
jgi:peptide/nickel transport system permease protein